MKNKVIVLAVAVAVAALAVFLIIRSSSSKNMKTAKAKKTFQKGMGGLTVKVKNSSGKPQYLGMRIFRAEDKKSGIFITVSTSEKMQELSPGRYDVEIDTVPPKLYKDIDVSEGRERVESLGAITGTLYVKALDSKKKEFVLPIKTTRPGPGSFAALITANRNAEFAPGTYNLEIATVPPQARNGVHIDAGKAALINLGVVTGSITVKALDGSGKPERFNVRLINIANKAAAAATITNRPLEILPGDYDIELQSTPAQVKKGIKVSAGEETSVEFTVLAPVQASVPTPAPSKKKK